MGNKKPTSRKSKLKRPKTVLRLLDLEHSKTTVLNSLIAGTECCNVTAYSLSQSRASCRPLLWFSNLVNRTTRTSCSAGERESSLQAESLFPAFDRKRLQFRSESVSMFLGRQFAWKARGSEDSSLDGPAIPAAPPPRMRHRAWAKAFRPSPV